MLYPFDAFFLHVRGFFLPLPIRFSSGSLPFFSSRIKPKSSETELKSLKIHRIALLMATFVETNLMAQEAQDLQG